MQPKVYELVFNFHTGMTEAVQQLKKLETHFNDRKQSLREDGMQIHELRSEILSYLLIDILSFEEDEAGRLFHIRYAREKKIREEDEKSIAKTQAMLAKGKPPKALRSSSLSPKKKAKRKNQSKTEVSQ